MSSGIDPLNLILIAIAVVVFWRLRSVLGTRTGLERPPVDPYAGKTERQGSDNVIPLPQRTESADPAPPAATGEPVWKGYAAEGSALAAGLEAIAKASGGFDPRQFVDGSKLAYEMVLESFAAGDKASLKNLLSKDVLESFTAAIDRRQKEAQKAVFQFVSVKAAELVQARLEGRKAQVVMRFRSEQINGVLDKAGKLVEGDDKAIVDIEDIWTFERDVNQRDPNWKLISTDESEAGK
ncbi:MAG: Tim44/TimA family putative adaptor protein [Proteobacteria bacterium]|nr:Tim44/TimA family putative adaptor protein [Pseudomonadota bacterium]